MREHVLIARRGDLGHNAPLFGVPPYACNMHERLMLDAVDSTAN